jgi:signal transduction histidine kinase
MRRFDTFVGRTILVSLIGITLMHVLSLWSYELALQQELSAAQDTRLAERLIAIRRSLAAVPEAGRDEIAHQLSGGPLEVHWSKTERVNPGEAAGSASVERLTGLPERLSQLAPDIAPDDLTIGSAGPAGDPHVALLSLRLPDKSWVNVSLFSYGNPASGGQTSGTHGTLLSTTLMAVGVVILSVFIAGWLTRPIRSVATAVHSLRPGSDATRIPATGPKEVRDLAIAFNDMQARIAKLIEERTRALAAVSHDLRTPLTRLKLRLEDLGSPELGRAMATDIADLEQMIEATLSYLKGESPSENPRPLDLTALLETIADEASDLGQKVSVSGPRHLIVSARHVSLKRAFSNLVQNAVKYGTEARITIEASTSQVTVHIDDDGPGIPPDKLDAVMEPFVRIETSRSRETGGVGLGLTIAKAGIEADGGSLALSNHPVGGLRATVTLPKIA